ncbi:MAG: peptidoglycan DD-metalloendopeptidase family protein [Rhodobacter sp.]|nr:peptidoglycan DD-metalloendopeptidase family protein [Rhodobacter sp.]
MADIRRVNFPALTLGVGLLALAACTDGLDLDLRDVAGGFDTSDAARLRTERRPNPDDRGIISYPNFQVAVARRGDTVADVAARVGVDGAELARHNGIDLNARLRAGEVIALPGRVAEPSSATGVGPIAPSGNIDITTLAGDALDRADARAPVQTAAAPVQTGTEPIRHRVVRGETAYSISRLYRVSVRSLADWNGLGSDLTVREGQILLIPVARGSEPPVRTAARETTVPGQGTPAPIPPSAAKPLPKETALAANSAPLPASPNLAGDRTAASGKARLLMPVSGNIIRGYQKGKTDGIDIAAKAGTSVRAATDGTVAAITRDTDQVPILVLRHANNLLTVYANIEDVKFEKGDKVARGQTIATVRGTDPSFLHFEVRQGFDSVDPEPYLN